MGLFNWLSGKKETTKQAAGTPPDLLAKQNNFLEAAAVGAAVQTGPQARKAWPEMIAIIERDAHNSEMAKALVTRMRSIGSQMDQMADAVAVQACKMMAQACVDAARGVEELRSRKTGH